ncbi:hypothetical protein PENFLA_c011G01095 [Penicillium flavigenum]|uniref:Mid2 domain-containing protein n=1 Tax=Penicillium flavigenum TaxID=254877 RepID=A0A1V6TAC8_9EURO|nr:hypothetical protein PENFLA_c011G01095 [Penicillium flavigenum]
MSTDNEYLMGYSLRRNFTCADGENDCGPTWNTSSVSFLRCCPGNTECPVGQKTPGICCPTEEDCSDLLDEKERCADPTADLYFTDQTGGYFCCSNDTIGLYTSERQYAGCVKAEDVNDLGVKVTTMRKAVPYTLPASASSDTATATTLSSSTSGAIIATSTSSNNGNTGTSQPNVGAIAGGVVGGIAGVVILIGLAWCLFRRRKKQEYPQDNQSIQPPPVPVSELSDSNRITELSGQSISELPVPSDRKSPPAELAA